MANITVVRLDETQFEVTVVDRSTTRHLVTVSADYAAKLSGVRETTEQLLERSFQFLLEREPNTSILRSFDLPLIGHYFPEYERVIRRGS